MATAQSSSSGRRKAAHGPTVNAIKRAKFEAKQERWRRQASLQQNSTTQTSSSSWYNGREEYSACITVEDVHIIKKLRDGSDTSDIEESKLTRLMSISDWIEPFFDLKEVPGCTTSSSSNNNPKKKKDRTFIAEGTETVRMMIQRCEITASKSSSDDDGTEQPPPIRLLSILSKPATFFDTPTHLLGDIEERTNLITNNKATSPFKIIIANEEALSAICGFRIARGAMACGVIPTYMQRNGYTWLNRLLSKDGTTLRLLALDAISNTANMGSILRTASAFSIDAIILSDDSCDAWYRQSVRTSMGHVMSIPILRVSDWEKGLSNDKEYEGNSCIESSNGLGRVIQWLRASNVECLAAVVDDDEEDGSECFPPLVTLEHEKDCGFHSWCCVLGNEGHGIQKEVIQECDKRIRIGMASSVDSLSLPIAAGILMHALSSRSS